MGDVLVVRYKHGQPAPDIVLVAKNGTKKCEKSVHNSNLLVYFGLSRAQWNIMAYLAFLEMLLDRLQLPESRETYMIIRG